ncbi:MAG TPA: hypothetical protein VK442_06360 [Xanthobacteraceae bacterium]|nr:hypothetical protein [Xanthobacteraceae bacterium]
MHPQERLSGQVVLAAPRFLPLNRNSVYLARKLNEYSFMLEPTPQRVNVIAVILIAGALACNGHKSDMGVDVHGLLLLRWRKGFYI